MLIKLIHKSYENMKFKVTVITMVEDMVLAIAYFIIAIHYLHLAIG